MPLLCALLTFCFLSNAAPPDEARYLPFKDRVSTRVVPDHLLGPTLPPGGTLGEYRGAKSAYRLGLIHLSSNEKAAFFLLDVKKAMSAPKYLPNMGGFYGMAGGQPLYVFAKGPYVAMVKGLEMEAADPIARVFAARIP